MQHLIVIGGGLMQLPVLRLAREMDLVTVCFDGSAQAPGAGEADHFYQVDIKDREACLAQALRHQAAHRLDGVVTVGTDFSTTVAWIAEHFGLPGIPFKTALQAKDKGLMRQVFAAAGVASPRFVVLDAKPDQLPRLPFAFPVVVKPADNMGARGVQLAATAADLEAALAEAWRFTHTGRVILEEYIDGPEFSLDAIVRDGQIHLCGFADRHIYFPPHFVELGHTFPSIQPPAVKTAVFDEFCRGIRALGITHGAAKGDIKWGQNGPVIGEIAARLSGGFMSGWTYPLHSGRTAIRWAIENALARPLTPQPEERCDGVAERALISAPGLVASVEGLAQAMSSPGVEHLFCSLKPGDKVIFPTNNVEKCGNLLVRAPDRAQAELLANQARSPVLIRLQPGRPETRQWLEDASTPWFFPAGQASTDTDTDLYGLSLEQRRRQFLRLFPALTPHFAEYLPALLKGGLQAAVWRAETAGHPWPGLPESWS